MAPDFCETLIAAEVDHVEISGVELRQGGLQHGASLHDRMIGEGFELRPGHRSILANFSAG